MYAPDAVVFLDVDLVEHAVMLVDDVVLQLHGYVFWQDTKQQSLLHKTMEWQTLGPTLLTFYFCPKYASRPGIKHNRMPDRQ